MCYNFFNKKPYRLILKTRILSRHGAARAALTALPGGAETCTRPEGGASGLYFHRLRPGRTPLDGNRVFSFRFSARFVAMLCMEMYNYKISQRDHSVCDGATEAETFL